MFPISDNNPTSRFPLINVLLIAVNLAVSFFIFRAVIMNIEAGEALLSRYALVPARDLDLGHPSLQHWALTLKSSLTSMFVHGGLLHLILNMWSLWIFGDNVESAMGRWRYLLFYGLCGLVAALTHGILHPDSQVPVVGASGAISGVMGAYMLMFPRARIRMFTLLIFYPIFFEIPAVVFSALWFLGQLLSAGSLLIGSQGTADVGGIAFMAHIGGFVAGIALTPMFRLRRR